MKEDKENTRPKEKRLDVKCEEGEKIEKLKEKREAMTKIVIRRLPPSLTKEELEEQLQPLPELDYLEFFSNDTSLSPHLFARAYINFKKQEDIVLFRDRFDGYVFIDGKGQEYTAVVEFAPFQKIAKKRSKKRDAKCGTIDDDPDYERFLEIYNGHDDEKMTSTPETLLEELEAKTKELGARKTTPLLDFLKNKQRIREEKKEERRRRELERKRLRDEERRKWRDEERRRRKDNEKMKKSDRPLDKDQVKEEPKIKLLRKPDRGDEIDTEKPKDKPKRQERPMKDDKVMGSVDLKKRVNIENKEDRARKVDEEGRKEFRDRDAVRDKERDAIRDRERRQKEKERIRRQDEDRRRRRERHDGENACRKREEAGKRDKDRDWEKKRGGGANESASNERSAKDNRKEENMKRDRMRNKDRPAIQLYQPGARNRNRGGGGGGGGGGESQPAEGKPDNESKRANDMGDD
ncbi:unnamed protein product [Lota lota]